MNIPAKMINVIKYFATPIAIASAMVACRETELAPALPDREVPLLLKSAMAGEKDDMGNVTGYRVADGVLQEILAPEHDASTGEYIFSPSAKSGDLYVLANASGIQGLEGLVPGSTTLGDLLAVEATTEELGGNGTAKVMTGSISLDGGNAGTVQMKRALARIDISSLEAGVKVLKVTVRNVADRGYLLPGTGDRQVEDPMYRDFSEEYPESGLQNATKTLLYLPEQVNGNLAVEVSADINGGLHEFRAAFPRVISRNTSYTINVRGSGTSVSATASSEDWEQGSTSGAEPSVRGLVDTENSSFPDGVTVSESKDTVYVPYSGTSFSFTLLAAADATLSTSGLHDGISVSTQPATRASLTQAATVSVTSARKLPGELESIVYIDVQEGGEYTGRVVLVFSRSPYDIKGRVRLAKDGTCDFAEWIEGEIATVHVPEGCRVECSFDGDESHWMKAEPASDGLSYRLLAGWKPNDPTADGRKQSGKLVITGTDGQKEEYTISRRNWGLPVVKIGETWWCRYNLKGNVKSFEDQITSAEDPARGKSLLDYLMKAPEDSLLLLMGDQYQGGNNQGLELTYSGGNFHYNGISGSAKDFGSLSPTAMAPAGYEIPDRADYAFLLPEGTTNYNLGGVGTRLYTNASGYSVSTNIKERASVTFLQNNYGPLEFYDFSIDGNSLVLFGLGHQWDTGITKVSRLFIMLATSGSAGKSWSIEGFASSSNKNNFKFEANNNKKTRTIRCIKTPVEYTYE